MSPNILRKDNYHGVTCQFGGQNAVNLAVPIEKEIRRLGLSTRILGTSPDAMDIAEDEPFQYASHKARHPQSCQQLGHSEGEARAKARSDRIPGPCPAFLSTGRPGHGDRP